MKGTLFALITLLSILILVCINSVILDSLIDQTITAVEKIEIKDTNEATERFKECYERFEKHEKYISLTVSHRDLTDIDECFSHIIGAGLANDVEEMIITKNRLTNSLEHLRRLSGINIDSILFVRVHIGRISSFPND